jgi:hypothetical protein
MLPFASDRAQFFLREGHRLRTAISGVLEIRFRHSWSRIFQTPLPLGFLLGSTSSSPQPVARPCSNRESRHPLHDRSEQPPCQMVLGLTPLKRRSGKQVVKGGEKLGRRGGISFKLPDAFQDLHKNLHSFTAIKTNTSITNDLHTHARH